MFGQGFLSKVHHTVPNEPIKLSTTSGTAITIPQLISASSPEFNDNACSVLNPLLFNGHLQTAYAGVGNFDNVDAVYYGRRILHYPDGGTGTCDYLITESQFKEVDESEVDRQLLPPRTRFLTSTELDDLVKQTDKPILLLLHGLSGGSFESYVRCVLSRLDTDEFNAVVLNARGCSRAQVTTPQLFCGLWTDDVRFLVKDLKLQDSRRPIYGVGFSLGSTILSNYLGQEGDQCPLTAACLFGNPWDMVQSSYFLHRSWIGKYLYSPVMCQNLKKLVMVNFEPLSVHKKFMTIFNDKFHDLKYLTDFDNAITCQMFGFNTAMEYYRAASPVNRVLNIRVPTLIINAQDDPIVGSELLPIEEVHQNPFLVLATTDYGGHLGWFKYNNERWYAQPVVDFFKGFHNSVKYNDEGKLKLEIEPILPHETCYIDSRLVMDNNPFNL